MLCQLQVMGPWWLWFARGQVGAGFGEGGGKSRDSKVNPIQYFEMKCLQLKLHRKIK